MHWRHWPPASTYCWRNRWRPIPASAWIFWQLPKTLPAKSLVNAVRFMAMGEQYAPIAFMTAAEEVEEHPLAKSLTKREMEVLKGLTEGKSNKEIARDLEITEPTIKLHVKTLYRKLDVNNRTQAAIVARDAGIF